MTERPLAFVLTVLLLAAAGCDDDGEEAPAAAATQSAATATEQIQEVLARFGGIMVQAHSHFVEVLPQADGQVRANVYDAEGNPVQADAVASVVVKVKGEDGEMHDVTMSWDEEVQRYVGEVEGETAVVSGPVEVEVEADGETNTGRVDAVAVADDPQYGGHVVLAGDVSAEVKADAEGQVAAVVTDAEGEAVTGREGVEITAKVQGEGEELQPVRLTWNEEEQRWVGHAEVDIRPGPMEVVVVRQGRRCFRRDRAGRRSPLHAEPRSIPPPRSCVEADCSSVPRRRRGASSPIAASVSVSPTTPHAGPSPTR